MRIHTFLHQSIEYKSDVFKISRFEFLSTELKKSYCKKNSLSISNNL